MADANLLQTVEDDLQLIYDVVAVLTPLAATIPTIPPLLERIHDQQADLLKIRQVLTGG